MEFMDEFFQPIPIYQPRVMAASSLGKMVPQSTDRPRFTPDTSRVCDVREARGGEGSFTFKDCDGNETGKLEWKNGLVTSTGDKDIEGGCDGNSSSI